MDRIEKHRKFLVCDCTIFIAMAVLGLARFFLELKDNMQSIKDAWEGISHEVMLGSIIGILAVVTLVYLYLGIMGLLQAKGKIKGKGHIVFGKVLFVICAIFTVIDIIFLIQQKSDVLTLCQSVASTAIMFSYVQSATILRKQ